MSSLEPDMAKRTADVARSRETVWTIMAHVVQAPSLAFVDDLRNGAVRAALEQGTVWVGENNPTTIHLQTLRAFEGRSGRISIDLDMETLTADWERLENRDVSPVLADWAERQPALCRAEREGWESGDVEAAKKARFSRSSRPPLWPTTSSSSPGCASGARSGRPMLLRKLSTVPAASSPQAVALRRSPAATLSRPTAPPRGGVPPRE